MMKRTLGKSGIEVSAVGMGCWAIGGPMWRGGKPVGWGDVNDDDSIKAVHKALDMGVTFFDTSDVYGCGHSEEVLARAFGSRRSEVVIATKFGHKYDPETKVLEGQDASPEYIRSACEKSLKRLQTDCIDLYQFHVNDHDPEEGPAVRETLEELVKEGKIRAYGWSTDYPERARVFAEGEHCAAIQQHFNVFGGNEETLGVCEEYNLASINRGPLGMGLLTGKFTSNTEFPQNDVRHGWNMQEGDRAEQLRKLEAVREILTSGGRTLAQGALCWLWARSSKTVPIPGFKTEAQVVDNAGALAFEPLAAEQMAEIDRLLGR